MRTGEWKAEARVSCSQNMGRQEIREIAAGRATKEGTLQRAVTL